MPASLQRTSRSAPTKACVYGSKTVQIDIGGKRHMAMDSENRPPPFDIGNRDDNLAIKAAKVF